MYSNEDYLVELMLESGYLDHAMVEDIRSKTGGENLMQFLLEKGEVTEAQVGQVSAVNSGYEFLDLNEVMVSEALADRLTVADAKRFRAVPVADDGSYLSIAVADPLDFEVIDSLPHITGREIHFYGATPSSVSTAMGQIYGTEGETGGDDITVVGQAADEGDAPVIKLVNGILAEAFKMRASDIHIEPLETSLRIRNRVDGKLQEVANHPKKLLPAVIARLKVMSGSMSIAEKRLPQDGRIQIKMGGKEVDLRVSSVPSNHGESIVMRILDKSALSLGLGQLGFMSDDQETFKELIALPDGIILVTGPTGSGKTTTLYACLNELNRPDKKIITVEDPVEYEMPGINQVMVKADIGMTFGAALRSMLRQAPNIIMVGEIRDAETANIAINASLTGHLVLSTLHTNDAPSAVARLADIGIKRFLIASAVRAILAQRLVRRLCDKCATPGGLSEKEQRQLQIDAQQLATANVLVPTGCDNCGGKGYRGRLGIYEVLTVDDELRHAINQNFSTPQLRKRARELGMKTLREDGILKVLTGVTTAEEVISVTMADSAH